MSVLVTDQGFGQDDWTGEVLPFDIFWSGQDLPEEGLAVEFPNDRDPADLAPWLERLALIRVAFPAMSDGRGFSIARRLRDMGYAGRLRAAGPLVADQLRAARRVGFDEIELPEAMAERQPEAHVARPAAGLVPGAADGLTAPGLAGQGGACAKGTGRRHGGQVSATLPKRNPDAPLARSTASPPWRRSSSPRTSSCSSSSGTG